MKNEITDFNIKTIPKLIGANTNETYLNYFTGGLIGGSILSGLLIFTCPAILLPYITVKIITTGSGIGVGSYLLNKCSFNYYEHMDDLKKACIKFDNNFITNLENSNYNLIWNNLYKILININHPIGYINYQYMYLYKEYDQQLIVLRYHINQINSLILYIYNITKYNMCNYIKTCIERIICKQTYDNIYTDLQEKTHNNNELFMKKKYNPIVQKKITEEIYKYDLNYKVLIEMMNTILIGKTPDEKISCITTLVKQINLELNNNVTADNLLDILSYILINSNIDNPYDELIYMDEYSANNSDLNAYTLVSFNAVIDYIKLL